MVKVGLVGVGNCASSLVQGAHEQVRFTAAFDVDPGKVGRDLSEAIWAAPNNARRFADVPHLGVTVSGPSGALEGTDVLVNFLPTGNQEAAEHYAAMALEAGCAFVNCMPAVLARSPEWARRFADAGVPLIGDDLKSQFGSTLVHRALVDALSRNGVKLTNSYQLNNGGNMDFLALQDPAALKSKQATKAQGAGISAHVGAAYVPWLEDRKVAYIRLEGEGFGGTAVEVEVRMSVEDSPSAAGNVLAAIEQAKRALDAGIGGVVPSALMKSDQQPAL
ncbi:inositol-3-phosphate synthase [Nonomuraea sp. NPDC050556]|uniref:inositol-3-phosphate synthase n=1 Tax=Nonomuraea sp. NPDC050556 TaxID=3364369 RepID=UPI00378B8BAF